MRKVFSWGGGGGESVQGAWEGIGITEMMNDAECHG